MIKKEIQLNINGGTVSDPKDLAKEFIVFLTMLPLRMIKKIFLQI